MKMLAQLGTQVGLTDAVQNVDDELELGACLSLLA